MTRHERLEALLRERFPNASFTLFNDSAHHADHSEVLAHESPTSNTPEGAREHAATYGATRKGQTHFRLHISDANFKGKSRIEVHREIFAAIKPETDAGLHSFVIERFNAL
ncbi:MAG: hypothetical protein LDLANPLL_02305 [Turneriella sp.]|nr:hypothetical protein [Turneriella sp.]